MKSTLLDSLKLRKCVSASDSITETFKTKKSELQNHFYFEHRMMSQNL